MTGRNAFFWALVLVAGVGERLAAAEPLVVEISADPSSIRLTGPNSVYTLLIHGKTSEGRWIDLTRQAELHSSDPKIAVVSQHGLVRGVADGTTRITIEVGSRSVSVPVKIDGTTQRRPVHFENDIIPVLSKFRCNSSGCHGKAEGQNGFKLSVFGFDPAADHAALTMEGRGRRVFPSAPDHSLLLAKISGQVAHGGGVRIPAGTDEYQLIRDWIAAGAPLTVASSRKVARIRVEPRERTLAMLGEQQLRVVAFYDDGQERDVTRLTRFQTNNEGLASVDEDGLVTAGRMPGDVAIMAAFMGAVDVFRAIVPRAERIGQYPQLAEVNFIDRLVFAKLKKLNIVPSDLAGDADFLRRVYLDTIGTLPTAAEARRFLSDKRPDRRARLVEQLLLRPEFADYWALKWADLLRVDRQALGHKHAYGYYKWIRDSIVANKPLDQFAREIVTSEGPLDEAGPASFYRVVRKPGEAASTLAQVFLGVRIACAECHHHPFDRWSQTDYYGMQAFFTQVNVKNAVKNEMVVVGNDAPTRHPRTGEVIEAHVLGTGENGPPSLTLPARMGERLPARMGDRRRVLAEWMTAQDNPWFARNLVNRTWAHFMGRGLVEPIDDMRATNPPSNPELLDELARSFIASRYDFRQLIRTIAASHVYQLSAHPNPSNEQDEQSFSRALMKRIDAEVLLDMVCQTTGVQERFAGVPAGVRAIQLWDSQVPHYFLKLFGRPVRASACECERIHEPGVSQVLHFMNSPELHAKLTHAKGYVARLVEEKADDRSLVDELYLTFYGRFPSESERRTGVDYLRKEPARRRQAVEDLAWTMLNSVEFVFNH
jgi:hypothetical protein